MDIQAKRKKSSSQSSLRLFKVGVVGASREAFGALSRIFGVTRYRTRSYQAVPIRSNTRVIDRDIDFIILCTNNPNVLNYWISQRPEGAAMNTPLIRVARSIPEGYDGYVITVPVNPSRLLKLLDNYTIKELNFFPEFEIGQEAVDVNKEAMDGLKFLQDGKGGYRRSGLTQALVVDDSLPVRRQVEIEFGLLGVKVDSVATAEEAIDAASKKTYDIIFMDVVMPGMGGYAACKRMKRCLLNKNTPVVLLTSRSSSFDRIRGALAGCDTYLIKPISHTEFDNVINKYFSAAKKLAQ